MAGITTSAFAKTSPSSNGCAGQSNHAVKTAAFSVDSWSDADYESSNNEDLDALKKPLPVLSLDQDSIRRQAWRKELTSKDVHQRALRLARMEPVRSRMFAAVAAVLAVLMVKSQPLKARMAALSEKLQLVPPFHLVPDDPRQLSPLCSLHNLGLALQSSIFILVAVASLINGFLFVGRHVDFEELSPAIKLSLSAIFTLAPIAISHLFTKHLTPQGQRWFSLIASWVGLPVSVVGLGIFAYVYGNLSPVANVFDQSGDVVFPFWVPVCTSMVLEMIAGICLWNGIEYRWSELFPRRLAMNPDYAVIQSEIEQTTSGLSQLAAVERRVLQIRERLNDDAETYAQECVDAFTVERSRIEAAQGARVAAARHEALCEFDS